MQNKTRKITAIAVVIFFLIGAIFSANSVLGENVTEETPDETQNEKTDTDEPDLDEPVKDGNTDDSHIGEEGFEDDPKDDFEQDGTNNDESTEPDGEIPEDEDEYEDDEAEDTPKTEDPEEDSELTDDEDDEDEDKDDEPKDPTQTEDPGESELPPEEEDIGDNTQNNNPEEDPDASAEPEKPAVDIGLPIEVITLPEGILLPEPVNPSLDISIKSDRNKYKPGDTITYDITITNTGDVDLNFIVVCDNLGNINEVISLAVGEERLLVGEHYIAPDFNGETIMIDVTAETEFETPQTSVENGVQAFGLMDSSLITGYNSIMVEIESLNFCEYGQPLEDNGGEPGDYGPPGSVTLPPPPTGGEYNVEITLDKEAREAQGCRTYEVELSITGEATGTRPIDLVIVVDTSGSMGQGSPAVWTKAKKPATNFVKNLLAKTDNRAAVVEFNHMDVNGEKRGINDPGSDDDAAYRVTFSNKQGDVNPELNSINVYEGGSNIEAGFNKAKELIVSDGRAEAEKVIIMFTDGLANVSNGNIPGPDWPTDHNVHTVAAYEAGQDCWDTAWVYTIGCFKYIPSESLDTARETLEWASNAGHYEPSVITEEEINRILETIYSQITHIGTDAVVTDVINGNFELVEDSFVTTPESNVSYDEGTRTITWTLGTLGLSSKLTYKIRANKSFQGGENTPTNDYAKLNYTNLNGNADEEEFPVPTVNVPPPLTVNAGPDREIFKGDTISIGANLSVSGGTSPYTYKWTCNTSDWSSTEENPSVEPQEETTYYIKVTDSKGCTASDSVKVTFKKGKISITKIVQEGIDGEIDTQKEFIISVKGPGGKKWNVFLKHDQTKEIKNLDPGDYTISEVVPMDYSLESISPSSVTITDDNLEEEVTVKNTKVNDSWFRDETEVDNYFTLAVSWSSEAPTRRRDTEEPPLPKKGIIEAVLRDDREYIIGLPEENEDEIE